MLKCERSARRHHSFIQLVIMSTTCIVSISFLSLLTHPLPTYRNPVSSIMQVYARQLVMRKQQSRAKRTVLCVYDDRFVRVE